MNGHNRLGEEPIQKESSVIIVVVAFSVESSCVVGVL